jgi:hypothetical protein
MHLYCMTIQEFYLGKSQYNPLIFSQWTTSPTEVQNQVSSTQNLTNRSKKPPALVLLSGFTSTSRQYGGFTSARADSMAHSCFGSSARLTLRLESLERTATLTDAQNHRPPLPRELRMPPASSCCSNLVLSGVMDPLAGTATRVSGTSGSTRPRGRQDHPCGRARRRPRLHCRHVAAAIDLHTNSSILFHLAGAIAYPHLGFFSFVIAGSLLPLSPFLVLTTPSFLRAAGADSGAVELGS